MDKRVVVSLIFFALGAITTLSISWYLTITAKVAQYDTAGLDGLMVKSRQVWCEQDKTIWWATFSKDKNALRVVTEPIKINADPKPWLAAVNPDDLKSVGLPGWHHLFHGVSLKPKKTTSITTEAFGWPMLAFHYSKRQGGNSRVISGAIDLTNIWNDRPCDYLPIHPIWFGALVDSALLGSALFIIAFIPYYIRKVLRRKTGFCSHCEYDMRHANHKVCPECGVKND